MKVLARIWEPFLEERPTAALGLFRAALALAIGLHVFPTLHPLEDVYLSGALRELRPGIFPDGVLAVVDRAPDAAVRMIVAAPALSWCGFLIGLRTQLSGAVLALACLFLFARNSLHIGTMSFHMALQALVLLIVTPHAGDSFSWDCRRAQGCLLSRRRGPDFIRRLLQLQAASIYFYAGLGKLTAAEGWLSGNPIQDLLLGAAGGVAWEFPGREWLAGSPGLCRLIGVTFALFETTLPVWLFWRRSRIAAICAAVLFHVLVLATLKVSGLLFFLFVPQVVLLFPPPEWWEQVYDSANGHPAA